MKSYFENLFKDKVSKRTIDRLSKEYSLFSEEILEKIKKVGDQIYEKSWIIAIEFFSSAYLVYPLLKEDFIEWMNIGKFLSERHLPTAKEFFEISHRKIKLITPQNRKFLLKFLLLCLKYSWKSIPAILTIFPEISNLIDFPKFMLWMILGIRLCKIDQDVALAYFKVNPLFFKNLSYNYFIKIFKKIMEFSKVSWKFGKAILENLMKISEKIEIDEFSNILSLFERILKISPKIAIKLVENLASILEHLYTKALPEYIEELIKISEYSIEATCNFIDSSSFILSKINIDKMKNWVDYGITQSLYKQENFESYFSLKTKKAKDELERLVSGISLKDIITILRFFAEAFAGKKINIKPVSFKKGENFWNIVSQSTQNTIFLPSVISDFEDDKLNFKLYKLLLVKELAKIEFGFYKEPDKKILKNLIQVLQNRYKKDKISSEYKLSNFFELFPEPEFAKDIFETLEEIRINYLLNEEYKGISKDMEILKEKILQKRALCAMFSLKKRLLEAIFQYSVIGCCDLDLPSKFRNLAAKCFSLASKLCSKDKTIDDSLILTVKIYDILNKEIEEPYFSYKKEIFKELSDEIFRRSAVIKLPAIEKKDSKISLENIKIELEYKNFDEVEEKEEDEREFKIYFYDEWDHNIGDYKISWCRVREKKAEEGDLSFITRTLSNYSHLISKIKRQFQMMKPERIKKLKREIEGDDLDIDALIESLVEIKAKGTPSDRVYIRRDKKIRDVSVGFLIDLSGSTEGFLEEDKTKRIIDIEKEALILMIEALEAIGDEYALFGFSSYGRKKVDFFIIKDFSERYDDTVKARISSLKPLDNTRLGAALRHAKSYIEKRQTKVRLLIILSDGKPYDFDYEYFYAQEDTKKALFEIRQKNIYPFCITIDKKASEYVKFMFGDIGYTIVDEISSLPEKLPLIYKKLTT